MLIKVNNEHDLNKLSNHERFFVRFKKDNCSACIDSTAMYHSLAKANGIFFDVNVKLQVGFEHNMRVAHINISFVPTYVYYENGVGTVVEHSELKSFIKRTFPKQKQTRKKSAKVKTTKKKGPRRKRSIHYIWNV
jgi:diadenosine tetraphosphate (Ap4A) HIT family hydrolase